MSFAHSLDKNSHIPIEEVTINDTYSFTINPSDDHQFFKSNTIRRVEDFRSHMEEILDKYLKPFAKYRFYLEISPKGRLHLHGTVKIHDILGYYLKWIPSVISIASTEMDKIKDHKVWLDYCTKQSKIFPIDTIIDSELKTIVQITKTPIIEAMNRKQKRKTLALS